MHVYFKQHVLEIKHLILYGFQYMFITELQIISKFRVFVVK
jgi:hypothetical protein